MNKLEVEAALNRHLEATAHALINVRGEGGSCQLCQALRGEQHLKSCPMWRLIDSRIQFRVDQEAPPPVMEVLHTDTGHFYRRRRAHDGGGL